MNASKRRPVRMYHYVYRTRLHGDGREARDKDDDRRHRMALPPMMRRRNNAMKPCCIILDDMQPAFGRHWRKRCRRDSIADGKISWRSEGDAGVPKCGMLSRHIA